MSFALRDNNFLRITRLRRHFQLWRTSRRTVFAFISNTIFFLQLMATARRSPAKQERRLVEAMGIEPMSASSTNTNATRLVFVDTRYATQKHEHVPGPVSIHSPYKPAAS